ncbi:type IV pilus assembly protein PilM [Cellulomonas humilata]|uniref:Type IV pilus assembly protein PilM n=1 Tax=Cellulomonas humilata TaxID=144055 RepID=A0A7Y6A224_9CELL|nr:type IV pilus assembly protein PilM [Cellulomonas humilata]
MAKTRVIGLDIGTTAVRAAQLEFGAGGKGQPSLVRYGEVALPLGAVRDGEVTDQGVVTQAIKQLWATHKFDGKDVVIGVGNQRVVVRDLALPYMPLAQLRGSLPFQVQELLPMATDEALLDFYPTGETTTEQGRMVRGLLVAAVRDTVTANVMAVESAGPRPTMVDLNAFALLRAMTRGDLGQRTVALVDIGARVTDVTIVAHGVPQFVRTLPSGGQDATDTIARQMNVSGTEAETLKRKIGVGFAVSTDLQEASDALATVTQTLIEAVRNTFVYYSSNNPGAGIDVVVLTGGGSHLPGLGQYLSSASRLPVTLGDPLASLNVAKTAGGREAFAGHESLMALPVGLAFGVAA